MSDELSRKYLTILGEQIYQQRTHNSLSQEKLADLSNLHRTYISKVEHGNNLTVKALINICSALDLKPSEILKVTEGVLNNESK